MKEGIITLLFIIIIFSFALAFVYLDYKEDVIALQNGYVQKVVNNKKIWVKPDCSEGNNSK